MWRPVVLEWRDLPGRWRERLHAALDVVADVAGDGYVVIDERCPGLDGETLRGLLGSARDGRARVGVRPVTDTVKQVRDGIVTATVERAGLVQVAAPLVVPAAHGVPEGASLAEMAAALGELVQVEVPAHARRLADLDELRLLVE